MSLSVCPLQVEDNQDDCARLREATRRLYAQLTEMEKRHREEMETLQVCLMGKVGRIDFLSAAMNHSCAPLPVIILLIR